MSWIFNFLSFHVVHVTNQPFASGLYKTHNNWNNPKKLVKLLINIFPQPSPNILALVFFFVFVFFNYVWQFGILFFLYIFLLDWKITLLWQIFLYVLLEKNIF